jgi:acetylornithine deacetylase/succinyl-diaminopimelate desuccinylase-like protein
MTPAELLQRLIRFDTRNPPGGERECIAFVDELLREAGLETTIVAKDPDRPSLVARLPGDGSAEPLLLQGHVDVVPTEGQDWSRDPLGGELVDGWIWGRGALDMKSGVTMMLDAVLRAKREGFTPAGDLVLAVLADEEDGGGLGAKHLVTERPELLDGVRYAIGEFGGFTQEVAGRRFYPIQVTEKQVCGVTATFRGPAGHGSMPVRGGAVAKLAAFLRAIDRRRLPVHVTPVATRMIEGFAGELPRPLAAVLHRLLDPRTTDAVLRLLGDRGRLFDPLLHNTVSPTIVRGGVARNVIPGEVSVELDGRLVPGQTPEDLLRELRALAPHDDVELEMTRSEPGPPDPDYGLFDLCAGVLREADPDGTPVPMILPAITDARHFGRLGIQGYGFTPLQLPSDFRFTETVHAADERVPAGAVAWGADRMFRLIERYGRS